MVLAMVVGLVLAAVVLVPMGVVVAAAATVLALGEAGFGHVALPHSGSGPPPC